MSDITLVVNNLHQMALNQARIEKRSAEYVSKDLGKMSEDPEELPQRLNHLFQLVKTDVGLQVYPQSIPVPTTTAVLVKIAKDWNCIVVGGFFISTTLSQERMEPKHNECTLTILELAEAILGAEGLAESRQKAYVHNFLQKAFTGKVDEDTCNA